MSAATDPRARRPRHAATGALVAAAVLGAGAATIALAPHHATASSVSPTLSTTSSVPAATTQMAVASSNGS
jgi:hypothetical protein